MGLVLVALALAAAIFFWGRGIRRSRRSDLIAGPSILALLCLTLRIMAGGSGVLGTIGVLVMVFGLATVLLSGMVRPGSTIKRGDVAAIGMGMIIWGLCLCVLL